MTRSSRLTARSGGKRSDKAANPTGAPLDQEYRVGPGRPPKEHQFKPGQSGNPKGAKRKPRSVLPEFRALFERALNEKVTLRQGEKEKIVTKAAAGIEQLINQFAKGDRHARRDLIALADKFGIDLGGQDHALGQALAAAVSANDEALLEDYVQRHSGKRDVQKRRDDLAAAAARTEGLELPDPKTPNPTKQGDDS